MPRHFFRLLVRLLRQEGLQACAASISSIKDLCTLAWGKPFRLSRHLFFEELWAWFTWEHLSFLFSDLFSHTFPACAFPLLNTQQWSPLLSRQQKSAFPNIPFVSICLSFLLRRLVKGTGFYNIVTNATIEEIGTGNLWCAQNYLYTYLIAYLFTYLIT